MARRRGGDPLAVVFKLLGALLMAPFKPSRSEGRIARPMAAAANGVSRPEPRPLKTAQHRWPAIGEFDFCVVGESHYQRDLEKIAAHVPAGKSFEVQIAPEQDNPHDKMAVAVRYEGAVIAYMARGDARSYRRRLSAMRIGLQPATCDAVLVGGHQTAEGRAYFGVQLDIKPFD